MPHRNDQIARAIGRDAFATFATTGNLDLAGCWAGWRIRGRQLIGPDGCKTNPRELGALLYFNGGRRVGPDGPTQQKREASP